MSRPSSTTMTWKRCPGPLPPHRVSNRIATHLERFVYRPAGHTRASFRVLFTLWSVGTLSQKDLAHLAGVTPPSMSAVLKSLESRN